MRKIAFLLISAMTIAGCAVASAQDVNTLNARATRGAYRPGQVIVKFKASSNVDIKASDNALSRSSSVSEVDKAFKEIGVKQVSELMPLTGGRTFQAAARGFNGQPVEARPMEKAFVLTLNENGAANVSEAVERLRKVADVEYAEPNYLVYALGVESGTPDDPYYSLQYGIDAINLPALWAQPIISKEGPVIAILDTGVDITHPDLEANIWTNTAETDGASFYDDDRNGFVDDLHGWDFVNQTGDIHDYNGHGTHCAGIAAACGFNGTGIVGANPDALIMPLTVLQSNGQGDIATIIKALDYATANGANIISMSLGSYSTSMAFEEALGRAYQNAVIIAAAGNDGYCLNHAHIERGQYAPMPMFPAAYTFVLGVQASAQNGGLASFSNYDDNGATFSAYSEDKLYNYEVTVPGASIMSTYPGGGYKELNGTSMATPLVAGAVSRLLQAKEYTNKEELFGDLINSTTAKGDLDIYAAYNLSDQDRQPELQFVTLDMVDADGDGRADAGEEVAFYPVIRNAWGHAKNISFSVECAETVNNTFTILDGTADFGWSLSSYGKARAQNPVRIKFHDNVADGRIVRLKFTAQGDNAAQIEQELEVMVENAVELTGLLREDMTLTPDQHYVVTGTFGVSEERTLTIMPGTTIKFRDDSRFIVEGKVIANGEPGNMITFTKADLGLGDINKLDLGKNDVSFCKFVNLHINGYITCLKETNCIYDNISGQFVPGNNTGNRATFEKCLIQNFSGTWYNSSSVSGEAFVLKSNVVNNDIHDSKAPFCLPARDFSETNVFNNYNALSADPFSVMVYGGMGTYTPNGPLYFGTSLVNIAKNRVIDINHPLGTSAESIAEYDFGNMPTKPIAEAPGIVWKVVVNGYDAQDEFDKLPALGVGTHKFEVYFNRPMNKTVIPTIAMGVRTPYTQTAIGENGSWNDAGDVYTAYLTISGKSSIDGLNRIYVAGAEDNEYFPIPVEDSRFNVLVQAAGSLSEGFMAEAGLGRVNLTWDSPEDADIDDMLGFNMYRYELDADGNASDPICINRQLLEPQAEMLLTDYDVVPRKTYCYYYKVMRTDMSETSPSKTVAVTPLTAMAGDANGSGDVNVADVVTTVNYASGLSPQPFIFEAADMNGDQEIDILDVVGIIRVILYPNAATASLSAEATATYWMDEDGTVYVDSPVELAGVQFNVKLNRDGNVSGCAALKGFEQTGAWVGDDDYIFMAYNMAGRTIAPGCHAIAKITNGEISGTRLSDVMGGNVTAALGTPTIIEKPTIDNAQPNVKGIYTVAGTKVAADVDELGKLPAGVYIVNGQKVIK